MVVVVVVVMFLFLLAIREPVYFVSHFITFISWNLSPPQLQYTPSYSGTPYTLVCLNTTVGAGLIIY
jgi:hypothetical protein